MTSSVPPVMRWYVYVTVSFPLPSRFIPTHVSHSIKDADRPSFKDGQMSGALLPPSSLKRIKDFRPPDITHVTLSHSSPARL